jgi:hypothetical protein
LVGVAERLGSFALVAVRTVSGWELDGEARNR